MAAPAVDNPPSFFVSLPTNDLSASTKFYESLAFTTIPAYSDSETITFRFPYSSNSNICLMVHSHGRFKDFIRPDTSIVEAQKSTGAIYTLALKSKDDVDGLLEKAVKAGGKKDPFVMEGYGKNIGVYTRSFEDVDGHIWEATTMLQEESEKTEAS